ncbi:MAG: hypothetical protein K0Q66_186 [Chitinophagaceae bacterium]|jgi:nucleoid DNA-binding protein|nr:hypothetical protein [Chitinophagaceae bacterium]
MLDSLYRYLFLKEQVSIPGVGSLRVQKQQAVFDTGSGMLKPPISSIVFEQGTALTDKHFYYFLAQQTGLSEVDAVRRFQDLAYQLRKDIQNNDHVELSGLGVFRRNATGNVVFEQDVQPDVYFPPFEVSSRQKQSIEAPEEENHGIEVYEETPVTKKDRWWIWAVALTAIAIAAVVYHYSLRMR